MIMETARDTDTEYSVALTRENIQKIYMKFNQLFEGGYKVDDRVMASYEVELHEGGNENNASFSPIILPGIKGKKHNCTSLVIALLEAGGVDYFFGVCGPRCDTASIVLTRILNAIVLSYGAGTFFDIIDPNRGSFQKPIETKTATVLLVFLLATALYPALAICCPIRKCLKCLSECKPAPKCCRKMVKNGFMNSALMSFFLAIVGAAPLLVFDIASSNTFDITDSKSVGIGFGIFVFLLLGYTCLAARYDTRNAFVRPSGLLGALEMNEDDPNLTKSNGSNPVLSVASSPVSSNNFNNGDYTLMPESSSDVSASKPLSRSSESTSILVNVGGT